MEFAYFHLMPYTEISESADDWSVANKRFDLDAGRVCTRTTSRTWPTPKTAASTGLAATSIT